MRTKIKKHGDTTFLISFYMYLFFTFTYYLRVLSVYYQMAFIGICYLLLFIATYNKNGQKYAFGFIGVTIVMLVFNFLFLYLQNNISTHGITTLIGVNFKLFYSTFPILFIYSRCLDNCDKEFLKKIIIVLTVFTCITTILGTYNYPSPSRYLAAMKDATTTNLYLSKNIGGYAFIYYLLLMIPVILYELSRKKSLLYIVILLIMLFCIIRSEYAIALLLSFVAVLIGLIFIFKNNYLRIAAGCMSVFVLTKFEEILIWSLNYFRNISYELYFRTDTMGGDLLGRTKVFMVSIENFINYPIFGSMFRYKEYVGEHSEFLDYLGHSGIFGLIILVFIIRAIIKRMKKSGLENNRFNILLIGLAIMLSVVNTFNASELFFVITIVPILFFSVPKDINKNVDYKINQK